MSGHAEQPWRWWLWASAIVAVILLGLGAANAGASVGGREPWIFLPGAGSAGVYAKAGESKAGVNRGPEAPAAESHAWLVLPVEMPGEPTGPAGALAGAQTPPSKPIGAAIMHVPPRGPIGTGAGERAGSADGTVRVVTRLKAMPEAVVARERELALIMPPERIAGSAGGRGGRTEAERWHRRVLVMSVIPGPVGDLWAYDADAGRLRTLASLPGDGRVVSAVAWPRGMAVLLEREDIASIARPGPPMPLELHILEWRGSWVQVDLPAAWPRDIRGGAGRLVAIGGVLHLLHADPSRPGHWRLDHARDRPAAEATWHTLPLSFSTALAEPGSGGDQRGGVGLAQDGSAIAASAGDLAPAPAGPIIWIRGKLIYAHPRGGPGEADALELWQLRTGEGRAAGAAPLARIEGVGREFSLAGLDQTGRLAILWAEPTADAASRPAPRRVATASKPAYRFVEVSALTGQVLYDGEARAAGPVSAREFRLLALALVGVLMLVLLFVWRPDAAPAPILLPPGLALAEPGRRGLAAGVDLLIAAIIAGRLMDAPLVEIVLLSGLFGEGRGIMALGVALLIGMAMGTIFEWLLGATPGKILVGCGVVWAKPMRTADDGAIVPDVRRPTFVRSAVRNAVKWLLPPVSLSGLASADGRHRGDTLAQAAVVIQFDDPTKDESPTEGGGEGPDEPTRPGGPADPGGSDR